MPVPPPPPFNRLFCPISPDGIDKTLSDAVASATKHLPGVHGLLITGDTRGLIHLAQRATLYLIAHGDNTRPVFCVGERNWNAKEMANCLETAGLKKDHKQVVMLVCNAGNTIGTQAEMNFFFGKRKEYAKLKGAAEKFRSFADPNKVDAQNRAEKELRADAKALLPKDWAKVNEKMPDNFPELYSTAKYIAPLVAQLVGELKRKGYSELRVRAFTGEVSNGFHEGIMIENTHWDPTLVNQVTQTVGQYVKVCRNASPENTVEWL